MKTQTQNKFPVLTILNFPSTLISTRSSDDTICYWWISRFPCLPLTRCQDVLCLISTSRISMAGPFWLYTTAVLILMTLSCSDTGSIQKEDSNLKGMIPWVWQYWDYLGDLAWGTAFLILPCILHAESRMLRSRLIRLILLVLMVVWNPLLRDLTQMWFGTNFHLANQTWVQGDLV